MRHVIVRMSCGPCNIEDVWLADSLLARNSQKPRLPWTYYIDNFAWPTVFREYERRHAATPTVLSSGSELIFQALLHCATVSVFGFYPFPTKADLVDGTIRNIPLYYYVNEEWRLAQSPGAHVVKFPEFHNFDEQHAQMLAWNASGLFDFYL